MLPVKIDLPGHYTGDTWPGLTIGPVLFNDAQPEYALASCRLYFRDSKTRSLSLGFQSEPLTGFTAMTILDPITWVIHIPAQQIPLVAGTYVWDFETTDSAGVVRTLYYGLQTVTEDISHD